MPAEISEDVLCLQAKRRCMYSMRHQDMLHGVPRYVRAVSWAAREYEEHES